MFDWKKFKYYLVLGCFGWYLKGIKCWYPALVRGVSVYSTSTSLLPIFSVFTILFLFYHNLLSNAATKLQLSSHWAYFYYAQHSLIGTLPEFSTGLSTVHIWCLYSCRTVSVWIDRPVTDTECLPGQLMSPQNHFVHNIPIILIYSTIISW